MMNISNTFDFQLRTRLIFGNDAVDRLGTCVADVGGTSILLVTDAGIVRAGHVERALHSLKAAGCRVHVYDRVIENPTTETVSDCVNFARHKQVDLLVGLGGGSSIDTAKGCNFILTNGGTMQDYWGVGKAHHPMLPLVAVPTTAGTGSECQSFALISDAETHTKMACGDPKAAPVVSILDPTLSLSQPGAVTACTGVDAIAHALETAVTKKRNAVSWMFSRESFRLTHKALVSVFDNPHDLDARGDMLLGAAYAGMAIENSMLGAAHAAANPLTARYNIVHGQAVGMMLPHVIRLNASHEETRQRYKQLAVAAGLGTCETDAGQAVDLLIHRIDQILDAASMKRTLQDFDIDPAAFDSLAQDASRQWTGTFNPVELTPTEYLSLYETASLEVEIKTS